VCVGGRSAVRIEIPRPPHAAKTQYQKFETNVLRKGIARLSPNFHIHVSVSYLLIPRIDLPILLQEKNM
jgi:hypothetical protein